MQLEARLVLPLQGPASSVSPREGQSRRAQGRGTSGTPGVIFKDTGGPRLGRPAEEAAGLYHCHTDGGERLAGSHGT